MTRVAVLHTSPATLPLFKELIRARAPEVEVVNILDDSILPQLQANGGATEEVLPRWRGYAMAAQAGGADVILNACSSIGGFCAPLADELGIAILRVDAAMAEEAVRRGSKLAVIATLASTLRPTIALLNETAQRQGRSVSVVADEAEGAYEALMAGDQPTHDSIVAQAILRQAAAAEVVVLAQASMARVLPSLPPAAAQRCLTSPSFAADAVVDALSAAAGMMNRSITDRRHLEAHPNHPLKS